MSVKIVLNSKAIFQLCRAHSPRMHHEFFDGAIASCDSKLEAAQRDDDRRAAMIAHLNGHQNVLLSDAARVEGEVLLITDIETGLGIAENG
jgi:hypothetical protein